MELEDIKAKMDKAKSPRVKSDRFDAFLEENKIEYLAREEYNDEMRTVVYRGHMEAAGSEQPTQILFDDGPYIMIRVLLAHEAVKEDNMGPVLMHINQLNDRYKAFKFLVDSAGNLCLSCTVIAGDDNFDPDMIMQMLMVILRSLEEDVPTFRAILAGASIN